MRRFWEFIKGVKWFSWLIVLIWLVVSFSRAYVIKMKYIEVLLIFGFISFLPVCVYEFSKNPIFQNFWEKKSKYKIVNCLKASCVVSRILFVYWFILAIIFLLASLEGNGAFDLFIFFTASFVFWICIVELVLKCISKYKNKLKEEFVAPFTGSFMSAQAFDAETQHKCEDIPSETNPIFDVTTERDKSDEQKSSPKASTYSPSDEEKRKRYQEEIKHQFIKESERRQKEEQRLAEERERRRKEEEERRKREDYERFIHERDATSQKKQQRRQRYQQQYSVDLCRVDSADFMEGHSFEHFCADLLRDNGYIHVSVTPGSGDHGADIIAEKDGIRYAIQCKNYASPLSNTPVQEVNAGKMMYKCHVGVVMTNSTFTPGAKALADATGVLLWDRTVLQKMMASLI